MPPAFQASAVQFPIVGIGASAGGLQAFIQLLSHLDADTGMAYLLVQHLDPNHESQLSTLLGRVTGIQVKEAADGEVIQPNHAYVIPPNAQMTLAAGKIVLVPRESRKRAMHVIDDFFCSLAEHSRDNAIGVVLSGTGSDGTKGLTAISDRGGVTFAQEQSSSKFSSMPTAALAAGVDFILSPEGIAHELGTIARTCDLNARLRSRASTSEMQWSQSIAKLLGMLRAARGMDFSHYKMSTIHRRILRRMALKRIDNIDDYVTHVAGRTDELDNLYEDILIKVTCFFRSPDSYTALKETVIPGILSQRPDRIRVWVPGCSTGEEAYSIAICMLEALEEAGSHVKVEIFATDISEVALSKARLGHYDDEISKHVSPERLTRFFVKDAAGYRIMARVRDLCLFARQDITRDPPFSKLDLVSCRNLLIYLSPELQKRAMATFHFALNPHGFLTLGSAESIGSAKDLFDVFDKSQKFFRKKEVTRRDVLMEFQRDHLDRRHEPVHAATGAVVPSARRNDVRTDATRAIQSMYVPPGVVIDERMDVVEFRGDTSPYLVHPPGGVTSSFLKLCREGLLVEVRSAIESASTGDKAVQMGGWVRSSGGQSQPVTIDVLPFVASETGKRHYVVLFSPRIVTTGADVGDMVPNLELRRLEQELQETRDYLNAIIEKEQASNEELKSVSEEILSANEELQSANEEMATAKEETQAANEELLSLNDELQSRNKELDVVSNDLTNLFGSVQIPIVMLSDALVIRHFTPSAEKILNLAASDRGLPLKNVESRLSISGLGGFAADVIETLNTSDHEVQDRDGRWYSLRVKPYRTSSNKIEGAVLAFVDIDSLKRSFGRLKEAYDFADAIVQTAPVPLLVLDENLAVVTANQAFYRHFNAKAAMTLTTRIYDLGNGQWNVPKLRQLLEDILPSNELMENYVIDHEFPDLGRRTMRLNARRLAQHGDKAARILLAIYDVTAETVAEERMGAAKQAAEDASQAKSDFLANMSHEIRTPLGAILGYSELLANPDQTKADSLNCATRIRRNVEQLTELIDEILDIAKIESGKFEVDLVETPLLPELAETFALLQGRAEGKGLAFNLVFHGEIPEVVKTCPKRLRQILINIAGNALKFTEEGHVTVTTRLDDGQLSFIVKDTGCGLSPEQQRRLFKPFSQADSSVTRRFGGTGLGLTLARRLAEALGGGVVLTASHVGAGSTFTVTIDPGPLAGRSMISALSQAALEQHKRPITDWFVANDRLVGTRVLLVEDGPDNQALMAHFLTSSGAVVDLAMNGAEGIQKAQGNGYDVVLMDIQMPVLDGYEATRRLRALGFEAPIVALTAHAMRGERERCLAAGCVDYISKPVKPELLIESVARVVKKKLNFDTPMRRGSLFASDPVIGPLVGVFLKTLPKRVEALIHAQREANWRELATVAHQMAGAAGGYGYPEIGAVAERLEAEVKNNPKAESVKNSMIAFESLCRRAIRDGAPYRPH